MKKKLFVLVSVISLAVTVGLVGQQQRSSQADRPVSGGTDSAILLKLQEIVAIRERFLKHHELMLQAGRAQDDGLAETELADARIELAQERGQRDAVVAELKTLVSAHERRVKRLQAAALDRLPLGDVERAKAALLAAEVRLLRAQK